MRAKLCGIRSQQDLDIAVNAGADAVGFISGTTHYSEDALAPEQAAKLAALTPPFVNRVLVTHLEDADGILALADRIGVDTIQLHGLIDTTTVRRVRAGAGGRTIIRAVHVVGDEAVDMALETAAHCDAVLLDSRTPDRLGGTGLVHDWSISERIVDTLAAVHCPVILAGGLNVRNVATAIAQVGPFGVDVNSGVETASGDKDPTLCAAFVAAAHQADQSFHTSMATAMSTSTPAERVAAVISEPPSSAPSTDATTASLSPTRPAVTSFSSRRAGQ